MLSYVTFMITLLSNNNDSLFTFILNYLGSENPDEEYGKFFKKEKRITSDYFNWFYQFILFPQIGYNEKKTEARIQAWLAKNSMQ